MKILFVCMQYIHSVRWINQLKNSHHEIFLFDCLDRDIHQDLQWTNYITNWSKRKLPYIKGEERVRKKFPQTYEYVESFLKVTASEKLHQIIGELKPDLVHSLEMQSESYPLISVKNKIDFNWAYFCWGSDLFHYKADAKHKTKIKAVLSNLNYFFADNNRDHQIARELGFKGIHSETYPGGGGYDLKKMSHFRIPLKSRNLILIKGYEHWAGRALSILNAIELMSDLLENISLYVYSAHPVVIEKIEQLVLDYKLDITYSSRYDELSQEELFEKMGQAKIAIANNVTDGIPNSLLETIILGAFPIQSNPGGVTEEYISHGVNGLLINNPANSQEIADLIKLALENDELIQQAFKRNQQIALNLEKNKIQERVLKTYQNIEEAL